MRHHYGIVLTGALAAILWCTDLMPLAAGKDTREQGDAQSRAEPPPPTESTPDHAESAKRLEKCRYVSRVDGATIEYALWYPPQYDPSRRWPMIVFLHGSGEGRNWRAPTKPSDSVPVLTAKSDLPFLVVFPLMRGAWSINGPAELDVLDTIDDVKARASVDADRIHLTGLSLGGFAGWALAAHYPHLFASLSVFAAGGQPELTGNLRHIAVRVFHGAADQVVPIDESRRMVEAMRSAGLPVEFTAVRRHRHVCWREQYSSDTLYEWMARQRRNRAPKRISYRTRSLRHNRAYWAMIDSMTDPGHPASIDVFVPDGSQVFIHAENVARLTLEPPEAVVREGTVPEFFVNDELARAAQTDRGWVVNTAGDAASGNGLRKRHGLSGPIQDVFYDSFVVVTPASRDPVVREAWRQAALFAFRWKERITFENFRFVTDAEVTPELVQSANLICFGNPEIHEVLGRVADELPVRFSEKGLVVNGRPASARIAALVMIYPNPLNPDRYIVVCSGRPQATARLAAMTLQPPYLASTPIEDLVVLATDGRLLLEEPDPATEPDVNWMAPDPRPRGVVFDRHWQLPESAVERIVRGPGGTEAVPPAPP